MATKTKALSTAKDKALAQQNEVTAMFGGDNFQIPTDAPLPRCQILRESGQFEMPDGALVKDFEGHILFWHEANTYWSHPFGEGDSPFPDCASSDGIYPDGGEDRQAEACAGCDHNEYGSAMDGGRGKACQNTIFLYCIQDGQRLPFVLKAPPSSLGKRESLIPWLTNSVNEGYAGKYQTCRVRLSLYKKEFDKFTASVLKVETIRVLDPANAEDAQQLQRLGKLFSDVQAYYRKRGSTDVATTDRYAGEADDCPI